MVWLKWIGIGLGVWCLIATAITAIICWFIDRGKKRHANLRAQWRHQQEASGMPLASEAEEDQVFGRTSLF